MMASSLEQSTGRILLDSSAPLTYLKTSASSGWSGAALTHMKTSGRGEFAGCWSALLLTYSLGSPNASYIIDAQGRRQRNNNRLGLLAPNEERHGGWDWETETINLFIQPGFVERVLGQSFDSSQIVNSLAMQRDDRFIEILLQALLTDVLAGCPNGPLPSESVVAAIVQRLQGDPAHDILTPRCKPTPQRLVKQAQDYIEAQLGESLHLDGIAKTLGLSIRQLSRLFRSHSGCSPYDYILRRRLDRACGLIAAGKLPLDDVAATTGFANRNHMTSCFRKALGKTPAQFRP
ncbi:MAG: AraC family transcriptional regulator [Betaproteobacteria bacterium]